MFCIYIYICVLFNYLCIYTYYQGQGQERAQDWAVVCLAAGAQLFIQGSNASLLQWLPTLTHVFPAGVLPVYGFDSLCYTMLYYPATLYYAIIIPCNA